MTSDQNGGYLSLCRISLAKGDAEELASEVVENNPEYSYCGLGTSGPSL